MATIFFWKPEEEPYGVFSQWFWSPFTDEDGVKYNTCEQYMMYQKAILFNDDLMAKEILKCKKPAQVKSMGRQVANFDEKVWNKEKYEIVVAGNMLKFAQNKSMRDLLLQTKHAQLAEASPSDRVWGIGFKKETAHANRARWGENLLGKALMEVRGRLDAS